jgi:heptosyltransferase III
VGRTAAAYEFDSIRRILLVQLRFLGDVLLCTPAIRAVRRAYPEARIEFLTSAQGVDVLGGNPNLDEILVWRPGLLEEWRLRRELLRRAYDAVVDFQSMPRTARLVRSSRAPIRVGVRGRGPRNRSYTRLVEREQELIFITRVKMQALAPLGVEPVRDLGLDIVVGEAERKRARAIWAEHGLDGAPTVAISAVAREAWKQWGAARWATVADGLLEAGFRVLLTSGPGEHGQVESVARAMRGAPVFDYGRTTLRELAAIYQRCALWVGNDGGPKHVASAAGVPTITVFRW